MLARNTTLAKHCLELAIAPETDPDYQNDPDEDADPEPY
jgi:hypothetical protein